MLKPQLCMGMVVGILAWLSAPVTKGADIDLHELRGTWKSDTVGKTKITPGNNQALGLDEFPLEFRGNDQQIEGEVVNVPISVRHRVIIRRNGSFTMYRTVVASNCTDELSGTAAPSDHNNFAWNITAIVVNNCHGSFKSEYRTFVRTH